jgi:tRNA splicing endonuclease
MCIRATLTLSAHAAGAQVRGGPEISALHGWRLGGFGELLHEPPPVAPLTGKVHPADFAASREPDVCMLQLGAVEAFYLAFSSPTHQLEIVRPPSTSPSESPSSACEAMSAQDCWDAFLKVEPLFPQLFAAYRALRGAGWNIRDGVKFGVDFALYEPAGGPTGHATHGCLVVTPHTAGERDWLWLQSHVRLAHTVAKELLLCTVEICNGSGEFSQTDDTAVLRTPSCVDAMEVRTLRVGSWGAAREHGAQSQTLD